MRTLGFVAAVLIAGGASYACGSYVDDEAPTSPPVLPELTYATTIAPDGQELHCLTDGTGSGTFCWPKRF